MSKEYVKGSKNMHEFCLVTINEMSPPGFEPGL